MAMLTLNQKDVIIDKLESMGIHLSYSDLDAKHLAQKIALPVANSLASLVKSTGKMVSRQKIKEVVMSYIRPSKSINQPFEATASISAKLGVFGKTVMVAIMMSLVEMAVSYAVYVIGLSILYVISYLYIVMKNDKVYYTSKELAFYNRDIPKQNAKPSKNKVGYNKVRQEFYDTGVDDDYDDATGTWLSEKGGQKLLTHQSSAEGAKPKAKGVKIRVALRIK